MKLPPSEPETLHFGDFRLALATDRIWRGSTPLKLTAKAFSVLRYLALHPERVVSKAELFDAAWPGVVVSDWALATCVREIRRVLGDVARRPHVLETVHGRGYRFIAAFSAAPSGNGTPPPVRDPESESRLVGRQTESRQLLDRLESARSGRRQIVLVTGEPGIGKTALVDEFLTEAAGRSDVWIARGQCVEQYGAGEAYLPVLEALGRLGRTPDGPFVKATLERHAPTWLIQLPALLCPEEVHALQARVAGVLQERMRRELAQALEVLTADRTIILVLEDLHWADPSTLALASALAQRTEPARLLVVGTYRSAEAGRDGASPQRLALDLRGHASCHEMVLPLLDEPAVADYLHARFPRAPLPPQLARVLHQRSDGHPLFLVSIVQEMVARGVLSSEAWTFSGNLDAPVPATPDGIRQLVAGQRARLQPPTRLVLEAASVAGVEFSAAEVAAALQSDVATVEEQCHRLVEHQLFLRAASVSEWPDGTVAARYAFLHAVYQELWLEGVSVGRRREWHLRIGERKDAAWGPRAGEIAAELAVHFEQGRDVPRALRYLQQAGENAQ